MCVSHWCTGKFDRLHMHVWPCTCLVLLYRTYETSQSLQSFAVWYIWSHHVYMRTMGPSCVHENYGDHHVYMRTMGPSCVHENYGAIMCT